jgi:hypothetical protein
MLAILHVPERDQRRGAGQTRPRWGASASASGRSFQLTSAARSAALFEQVSLVEARTEQDRNENGRFGSSSRFTIVERAIHTLTHCRHVRLLRIATRASACAASVEAGDAEKLADALEVSRRCWWRATPARRHALHARFTNASLSIDDQGGCSHYRECGSQHASGARERERDEVSGKRRAQAECFPGNDRGSLMERSRMRDSGGARHQAT